MTKETKTKHTHTHTHTKGFETAGLVNGANLVTCGAHFVLVGVLLFLAAVRFRPQEFATVRCVRACARACAQPCGIVVGFILFFRFG